MKLDFGYSNYAIFVTIYIINTITQNMQEV